MIVRNNSFIALLLLLFMAISCQPNPTLPKPNKNTSVITVSKGGGKINPAFIAYRDGDNLWILPTAKELGLYEISINNTSGVYDLVIVCPQEESTFYPIYTVSATLNELSKIPIVCLVPENPVQFQVSGTVSGFDGASAATILPGFDVNVPQQLDRYATPEEPTFHIKMDKGTHTLMAIRDSNPKRIIVKENVGIASNTILDFNFDTEGVAMENHDVTVSRIEHSDEFRASAGLFFQSSSLIFGFDPLDELFLGPEYSGTFSVAPSSLLNSQWNVIEASESSKVESSSERITRKFFKEPKEYSLSLPDVFKGTLEVVTTNNGSFPKIIPATYDQTLSIVKASFFVPVENTGSWTTLITRSRLESKGSFMLPDLTQVATWNTNWTLKQNSDLDLWWDFEAQHTDLNLNTWLEFQTQDFSNLPNEFEYKLVTGIGWFSLGFAEDPFLR